MILQQASPYLSNDLKKISKLKLDNVGGIFVLLLCGLGLGIICLGGELFWNKINFIKTKNI